MREAELTLTNDPVLGDARDDVGVLDNEVEHGAAAIGPRVEAQGDARGVDQQNICRGRQARQFPASPHVQCGAGVAATHAVVRCHEQQVARPATKRRQRVRVPRRLQFHFLPLSVLQLVVQDEAPYRTAACVAQLPLQLQTVLRAARHQQDRRRRRHCNRNFISLA